MNDTKDQIHNAINEIDDLWTLNQIFRFINNITKKD